jgi:hypothetical protein
MTVTSISTINDILNRVAVEVGFTPVTDPWTDTDQHWLQMRYLAQVTGDELVLAYPWEFLNKSHQITTSDQDSGDYPLPADFMDMLDQTGWERSANVPLMGPLSPQEWTYLLGRDLVSSTIYASFRIKEGKFSIFPQPPPDGLDVNFEYQSNGWVADGADGLQNELLVGTDIPLFDKTMFSRYLKSKWLDAKGFDSTRATDDFSALFSSLTGKDKGARILSAGGGRRGMPYLDNWRNTPDSGYGL